MKSLFAALLAATALTASAEAASFDCKKAKSRAEHEICKKPHLSELDSEIGREYRRVMALYKAFPEQAKALRQNQMRFISDRDGRMDLDNGELDDLMQEQARFLSLIVAPDRTSPVGNWRFDHGHLEISQGKDGRYIVEAATRDNLEQKWTCKFEGVHTKTEGPVMIFAETAMADPKTVWHLRVEIEAGLVKVSELAPEVRAKGGYVGMHPHCTHMAGLINGTMFPVEYPKGRSE